MREIKFRYRFRNRKTGESITTVLAMNEIEGQAFQPPVFKEWTTWEVLSRNQYIGLQDRHGKEIYEKDIVMAPTFSGKQFHRALVQWKNDNRARFWLEPILRKPIKVDRMLFFDGCEVIGNLYENPELL